VVAFREGEDDPAAVAREDRGEEDSMIGMTKRRIAKLIDVDRVRDAVRAAETRTSGEIRVSVSPWFWGSVDRAAERAFVRLGMTRTRLHNGVLFFLVPSRQAFVVRGDSGIHDRVGQAFWDELVRSMSEHFRRGEFTDGLIFGIAAAADQLALHFPYDAASDVDELPDEVDLS
jgi:uncharacterized membrane protein